MDKREAGARGGRATAAGRTPEERSDAARRAVNARWAAQAVEASTDWETTFALAKAAIVEKWGASSFKALRTEQLEKLLRSP